MLGTIAVLEDYRISAFSLSDCGTGIVHTANRRMPQTVCVSASPFARDFALATANGRIVLLDADGLVTKREMSLSMANLSFGSNKHLLVGTHQRDICIYDVRSPSPNSCSARCVTTGTLSRLSTLHRDNAMLAASDEA